MRHESSTGRARFEALYAAEGRRVLAYALRRTAQPADAADVLAEVFLVAWRRLGDVPTGPEARLWLYGVARGVLANQRRSLRRRERLGRRLAGVLTEHVGGDPADLGGGDDVVRAALAMLSRNDREVIQLTIWEQLSAPEVGAVLGLPPATVRTRLHRARRRLRDLLAEVDVDRCGGLGGDTGRAIPAAGDEHPAAVGHVRADGRPPVGDHEDQR
jgi:RNA polymerase sigma-70 factor (ECF subfamily)